MVAREVGIDPWTIYRWRGEDAVFDQAVSVIADANDEVRTVHVEETMYDRIIGERAFPAEIIFWLKNRGAGRWKDRQETVVTTVVEHQHVLARILGVDPAELPDPLQVTDERDDEEPAP